MKTSDKRKLKRGVYTAAQWTWGLPQTLAGALLRIAHRGDKHFDYNGAHATVWDKDSGVSLGKFIFVPRKRGAYRNTQPARPEDLTDEQRAQNEAHVLDVLDMF